MILVIDIGNTFIKCGVFDRKDLIDRLAIQSINELSSILKKYKLNKVIISSVVPEKSKDFINYINQKLNITIHVISYKDTNLKLKVEEPVTIGNDRICNIYSAIKNYTGPIIIIDFGTATTYDVINSNNEFIGGIIAPGIETSIKNLISKAALLKDIKFKFPQSVIGKNTTTNIQSGVMYGSISQVEGLINKIELESNEKYTVLLTGGFSELLSPYLNIEHIVDIDLTLKGMFYINESLN
ncbi:type III pantothenate kinase [Candidatus Marinimicrobia bacterium]|nr:type III pantothenate kinase [Candidatus Neomarinimicrobiota bacterium]